MSFGMDALNGAVRSMSQAFSNSQSSMATSLQRISTGKRFTRASEDLASFSKMVTIDGDRANYQTIKNDLQNAKVNMATRVEMANSIMDDLRTAKAFFTEGQDEAAKAVLAGVADKLSAEASGVGAAGADVAWIGGAWADVSTIGENGLELVLDTATLTLPTGTEADATAVQTSIDNMEAVVGTLLGMQHNVDSQLKLADVALDNVNAMESALTSIDEAREMANVIDQDIRQQAAISMLAQANMSRRSISMLYR